MMSNLAKIYSPKQIEVLEFAINKDFFMLANHGSKRSGKTVLDNDLFLFDVMRIGELAKKYKIKEAQYILAGSTLGALYRNVILELENKYGFSFKWDKYNRFELFGVKICCFGHSKINDLGRIRGMTSYGAYINEATMANQIVFNEIITRCSGEGARIICDTNPDNPIHWFKKDYIDNTTGTVQSFHFKLDDNTFLTERYKDNIKKTTPGGVFYQRDIDGLWVTSEGVVYIDFDENNVVTEVSKIKYYVAGVDWGYSHYGSIVILGYAYDNKWYLVELVAEKEKDISFWKEKIKELDEKYGLKNIWCDSARPDNLNEFSKVTGYKSQNANKSVFEGVGHVAALFKKNSLLIKRECLEGRLEEEIYNYIWGINDEPKKEYDDVLDAIRYALFSEKTSALEPVSYSEAWW